MNRQSRYSPATTSKRFPVLLESFGIRPHSGGNGHHHGGKGVIRRLRFLEPMTAAILSGRRVFLPLGCRVMNPVLWVTG